MDQQNFLCLGLHQILDGYIVQTRLMDLKSSQSNDKKVSSTILRFDFVGTQFLWQIGFTLITTEPHYKRACTQDLVQSRRATSAKL